MREFWILAEDDPGFCSSKESCPSWGPIAAVLNEMNRAGYWVEPGRVYNQKYKLLSWAFILLAKLGGKC
jgi:hypothetical protein